ncbi:uncharacterized protein PS065_009649 [Dugong dugon]
MARPDVCASVLLLRPQVELEVAATRSTVLPDPASFEPDKYYAEDRCFTAGPAGQYICRYCSKNHRVGDFMVGRHETYRAHSSGLTCCLPCIQWLKGIGILMLVVVLIPGLAENLIFVLITSICCYIGRGTPPFSTVISFFEERSREPDSTTADNSLGAEALLPRDIVGGHPAADVESLLLSEEITPSVPENGTSPILWEDQGESPVLLERMMEGRPGDRGQLPRPHPATNSRPQGRSQALTYLHNLEQGYRQKYFLKDTSCEATSRIYYEFGNEVLGSNWKKLMRFIGLEENEIEICERENPGDVLEQRYKMFLRWRNRWGREASSFKLMAALHKMELNMSLETIISKLVADDILGRRETQNQKKTHCPQFHSNSATL